MNSKSRDRQTERFINNATPVVVVNCKLGALAIMRSLGPLKIPLYGVDSDPRSPAMTSRYCKKRFLTSLDENRPEKLIEDLLQIGKQIQPRPILIPTSDETTFSIAQFGDVLEKYFIFPKNSPDMIRKLISKKEMFELAREHDVPTANTLFPENLGDVQRYLKEAKFPIMLKGIFGNRLQAKTRKKMVIVHSAEELLAHYGAMEDPDSPNLMLQEYIPGNDDQIYIFNGYFNKESSCLAGFTGHKIRQFPIHVGCASLGECRWNETVARITTDFMKAVHYQGILDIGYRWDPRDGLYKVLDINPRVGQAFRLFVSENDMDVVKALYLDLTGQEQFPIVPREGRRWLIEDFDMISSLHYYQEGSLKLSDWLRSFKKVEEGAWFSWRDPVPFLNMLAGFIKKTFVWILKNIGLRSAVHVD